MVISRCSVEYDNFLPVYKTEMVRNDNNPSWKEFSIPITTLCNGDRDRVLRIECFDGASKRTLIGSCDTSLNELLRDPKQKFALKRKNSQKSNKPGKQAGHLKVQLIEIEQKTSFLDFIAAGMQLCFHVAIDFTASNGNINLPSSLHYQQTTNQYIEALWNVGRICEDYDTDKQITAYGFGAKVDRQISHDFNLNLTDDANCDGIIGVLQAYYKAASYVEFFGPTNFAPIINKISSVAEKQGSIDKYHILLILTDGMISDMGLTKKALIRASRLPVSIIIVGVGNGNFDSMVELDSDNKMLTFQDLTADRDIVQFVAYHNFSGCFAAVDLAQEVLYEVPHQLTSYMEMHCISPAGGRLTQTVTNNTCQELMAGESMNSFSSSASFQQKEDEEEEEDEEKTSTISRKQRKNEKKQQKKKRKDSETSITQVNKLPQPQKNIKKEMSAKDYAIQALKKNSIRTNSLPKIDEILEVS